jgi:TonB-dependent starch-binding outer membrane protein SusC
MVHCMKRINAAKGQRLTGILFLLLLVTVNLYSQKSITGHVISADDQQALPGVVITEKGTNNGTVTDIEGAYKIDVSSSEAILVFSLIGMVTEQVSVADKSEIDLQMVPDIIGLEEIVVVGYGSMKKSDIAGSIVTVKSDEITEIKSNNVLESLQGKIPGLNVLPESGRPGADINMQLRGNRSLNASGEPLVIVDGIPMSTKVDINPNDIASMEILKDAASTAVYGSRGTNGIILITTKKGIEGKAKVYYNTYYSITEPGQKVPVMNRDQYYTAKIDAYRDYNNIDNWYIDPDPTSVFGSTELAGYTNDVSTDWQDLITRRGYQQDHHLGVMGGNEKARYNASISYFDEKGIVIASNFKRYNANVNLDAQVNKHLNAGAIIQLSYKVLNGSDASSSNYSVFTNAIRLSPMVEPYDSLGHYIWTPSAPNPRHSPLATVDDIEENKETRLISSVYADIMIFKGLNIRSTLGTNYSLERRGYMYPQKDSVSAITENGIELWDKGGYTWNNVLTFDKAFGKHHFIFTGVHEVQFDREEYYGYLGQEQPETKSLWYNLSTNNLATDQIFSDLTKKALVSFLGRINYVFNEKYILNGTVRADGASVLAPGYKWQYFPAASFAWRLSEEPFMQNVRNIFNDLKLRFSYGSTGNASIQPYSIFAGVNTWPLYVEFGENDATHPISSVRPTTLVAQNLTWERTNQYNLGLDFALVKSRIIGNVDIYLADTKNILFKDRLPASSGYFDIWANPATTETKGIELSLQTVNISTRDFRWITNITFSANKEKITNLVSGVLEDEANGWFVGYPINVIYDYKMTGIRQIGETDTIQGYQSYKPGDIRVADLDGNDTINNLDRTVLGQKNPKWFGTIDNTISYKGISLSFSIYAKWGHMVDAEAYDWDPRMLNNLINVGYWTPDNPTNEYPRLDQSLTETPFKTVISYREASFIKLRQITLNYNLPDRWLKSSPISKLSVYISSKNTAYLYSKMLKGIDPERDGSIKWPLARFYTFGLNVEF